ncbi:FAR1-related sequence 1 [Rhynchospora pubera]|uniref:Protein FAR1-RELATED SEQUENCE n=1 Tax=Rhynchospora pubera TaxID=906938 RepID=A0AAV8DRL1_9POAL|nr:FAR1-related sequence 1 [Rhynchospora pubera]
MSAKDKAPPHATHNPTSHSQSQWPRNLLLLSPYPPWAPPQQPLPYLHDVDKQPQPPSDATKPHPYITADLSLLPKLDMLFDTENDAYDFYNTYAENLGFCVRRSTLWTTSKNVITRRTFVCSREGFREKKKGAKEAKCPRPETRIGCPACMTIRLTSNGKYRVTEFTPAHNHTLATGMCIQTLRSKKLRRKARAIRENLVDESIQTPEFDTEEAAYEFYSMYAGKIGFTVRRASMTVGPGDVITRRVFVCSKEGFRERKKGAKRVKNPRPETRTGCPACMVIRLGENGKYHVTEFVTCHNHQLLVSSSSNLVLETGNDIVTDPDEILRKDDSHSCEEEKHLKSSRVKRVKTTQVGDVGAVLEYLQRMQMENPSFFYAMKSGENDKITNIFWADAKSITDFMHFGDVVCLDTGYRVHGYVRPLAIFTGLNHHKQSVIFGSALMYDESLHSFKWLFETFKIAMNGKVPKTILTDRGEEITDAIPLSWSGTGHRYCVSQIYQNALEQLSQAFHGSRTLVSDFSRCLFDCEEEEEFILSWNEMLEKYDLKDNKWLLNLFEEREIWALVYGREVFSGDFNAVLQKDSLSSELKKMLSVEKDILWFLDQYEKIIKEKRSDEVQIEMVSNQSTKKPPSMRILRQAANSYTPTAFKMFEREFELYMDCMVYNSGEVGTISEYRVLVEEEDSKTSKEHFVKFDSLDGMVFCTCKKFEFIGIPCRHVLKVLDTRNIKELPEQLILRRWRKDAKSASFGSGFAILQGKRMNFLCRTFGLLVAHAVGSVDAATCVEGQASALLDQVERVLQERNPDLSALSVENVISEGLPGHTNFISGTAEGPLTFPFILNAGALDYR